MVKALFRQDEQGYYSLDVTGHANYSNGEDIVCSAISAVSMALAGAINSMQSMKMISVEPFAYGHGEVHICVNETKDIITQKMVDGSFVVALHGLMQIERKYPRNILVTIENEGRKGSKVS